MTTDARQSRTRPGAFRRVARTLGRDAAGRARRRDPRRRASRRRQRSAGECEARRGRRASPEATRPQRWWMPLAAAATIGAIALGILQTVPPGGAPGERHARARDERHARTDVLASRCRRATSWRCSSSAVMLRAPKLNRAPQAGSPGVPPPAAATVRPAAPPASVPRKTGGKDHCATQCGQRDGKRSIAVPPRRSRSPRNRTKARCR